MKIPIRKVCGEVFCHESEDLEKVKKSFELFFPKKQIKVRKKKGAYGTNINIIFAELKGKNAEKLFNNVFENIEKNKIKKIYENLKKFLDEEGNLYLNFDKQMAYEKEKIKFYDSDDPIKIIFSIQAYPASYENILKTTKELLSEYM